MKAVITGKPANRAVTIEHVRLWQAMGLWTQWRVRARVKTISPEDLLWIYAI